MKLLLIAALLCLPTAAQTNKPKVIVISLDGFPAFALDDPKLPIPTLRKLMANGISGPSGPMTAINPTVTWPTTTPPWSRAFAPTSMAYWPMAPSCERVPGHR